jgi:hypothetical protein
VHEPKAFIHVGFRKISDMAKNIEKFHWNMVPDAVMTEAYCLWNA